MKQHKKRKAIPDQLLAIRKGNRDAEREILGDGFHVRTRIVRSKKRYYRKSKHRGMSEE